MRQDNLTRPPTTGKKKMLEVLIQQWFHRMCEEPNFQMNLFILMEITSGVVHAAVKS
jgi:hypothetical protein